jgi:hypothetical protein
MGATKQGKQEEENNARGIPEEQQRPPAVAKSAAHQSSFTAGEEEEQREPERPNRRSRRSHRVNQNRRRRTDHVTASVVNDTRRWAKQIPSHAAIQYKERKKITKPVAPIPKATAGFTTGETQ